MDTSKLFALLAEANSHIDECKVAALEAEVAFIEASTRLEEAKSKAILAEMAIVKAVTGE